MPITAKEIIANATSLKPHPEQKPEKGLFKIEPPIKLVWAVSLDDGGMVKGQTALAYLLYNERGKHPSSVQIRGRVFWWSLDYFDLAQD